MSYYNIGDLKKAFDHLPLERGDVVFIHSNLGFFGRPAKRITQCELCEMFFKTLMKRLGNNGTIIVPTYTYSFPRGEIFDPANSTSKMGIFAEWVRKHPKAKRSVDPSYSVSAIGTKAVEFTWNAPENSFSPEGFFGRFLLAGGVILNFNFDAGSTFLHYCERELSVPYRFDKTFGGCIVDGETKKRALNTIFVRYLSSDLTTPAFETFDTLARKKKKFTTITLGRGEMGAIRAQECFQLLVEILPKHPWLLTRAQATGLSPEIISEPTYSAG